MKKQNLLIGFTGSVASILSSKICEAFLDDYNVRVVVTEAARQFVNVVVLQDELKIEVLFDNNEFYRPINPINWHSHEEMMREFWYKKPYYQKDDPILHIQLRDWADCLLIAPCSVNTLAKMSNGICDNLLTSVFRAWDFERDLTHSLIKRVVVAPAANCKMWEKPITLEQVAKLEKWGVNIVYPVEKKLACGETGIGAMADIKDIVEFVKYGRSLKEPQK